MLRKLFRPKYISTPSMFSDGMDMHTHILWGVDDGAHTLSDSIGIIRQLKAAGLSGAYCTPHIMARYPQNTPAYLQERFSMLVAELTKHADVADFRLRLSAEYMLDDRFMHHLSADPMLTHEGGLLLIELPQHYLPGTWKDMISAAKKAGYHPLLAHPERYGMILEPEELEAMAQQEGLKFQGNIGSLTGMYGKEVATRAKQWQAAGFYHCWGTDSHTPGMARRMNLKP